ATSAAITSLQRHTTLNIITPLLATQHSSSTPTSASSSHTTTTTPLTTSTTAATPATGPTAATRTTLIKDLQRRDCNSSNLSWWPSEGPCMRSLFCCYDDDEMLDLRGVAHRKPTLHYLEPVYFVTALVPSDTACFANSPGSSRRTAVWISLLVIVEAEFTRLRRVAPFKGLWYLTNISASLCSSRCK
uniref:Secreted protein n=1 Tax=Mesocestoides corti TaxID=53468 RepID=A0A5K3G6X4_MESCO